MTQEQIDHRVEKMLDHLESQLFARAQAAITWAKDKTSYMSTLYPTFHIILPIGSSSP